MVRKQKMLVCNTEHLIPLHLFIWSRWSRIIEYECNDVENIVVNLYITLLISTWLLPYNTKKGLKMNTTVAKIYNRNNLNSISVITTDTQRRTNVLIPKCKFLLQMWTFFLWQPDQMVYSKHHCHGSRSSDSRLPIDLELRAFISSIFLTPQRNYQNVSGGCGLWQ